MSTPPMDVPLSGADELRAVQVLRRAISSHRLAHAILLYGENLRTLETVALQLASDILGAGRTAIRSHPDLFVLRTRGKARQITIGSESERSGGAWPPNTMRRFIHDLRLTPNAGLNKVGLVIEADRMNPHTANAFLKTLEEPPTDTTLFLLTVRPFDLLETIRSRCLSFAVPSSLDQLQHPAWLEWRRDYLRWLTLVASGPTQPDAVAQSIMGLYGLICRFEQILSQLSDAAWAEYRSDLPDSLTEDETGALETGIRKSIRQQMFGDIERATHHFGVGAESLSENSGPVHPRRLARSIETLEHFHVLVDKLNLNEPTALEAFFLHSLRIWSNRD